MAALNIQEVWEISWMTHFVNCFDFMFVGVLRLLTVAEALHVLKFHQVLRANCV